MKRAEKIETLLKTKLQAERVIVEDQSALHQGHAGARPEGQTHYHVTVIAEAFAGMPRVKRHQKVYQLLEQEFDTGLHALAMTTKTPGEMAG